MEKPKNLYVGCMDMNKGGRMLVGGEMPGGGEEMGEKNGTTVIA